MHHRTFCIWHLHHHKWFIYIFAYTIISFYTLITFLFMPLLRCVYPPTDEWIFKLFLLWLLSKIVALNIHAQVSLGAYIFSSLGDKPQMGIAPSVSMSTLYWTWKNWQLFFKTILSFYTSSVGGLQFLHIFPNTPYPYVLNIGIIFNILAMLAGGNGVSLWVSFPLS